MTILCSHDPLTLVIDIARLRWPSLHATVHWSDDTSTLLDEEETAELIARLDEDDSAELEALREEVRGEGRDPDEDLRIMPPIVPLLPLDRSEPAEIHLWTGQSIDEGIHSLAHGLAQAEAHRRGRLEEDDLVDALREELLTAYVERVLQTSAAALAMAAAAHAGGVGGRD